MLQDVRTSNQIFLEHAGLKTANEALHENIASLRSMLDEKNLIIGTKNQVNRQQNEFINQQEEYIKHRESFFIAEIKRLRKQNFWSWVLTGVSLVFTGYFIAK